MHRALAPLLVFTLVAGAAAQERRIFERLDEASYRVTAPPGSSWSSWSLSVVTLAEGHRQVLRFQVLYPNSMPLEIEPPLSAGERQALRAAEPALTALPAAGGLPLPAPAGHDASIRLQVYSGPTRVDYVATGRQGQLAGPAEALTRLLAAKGAPLIQAALAGPDARFVNLGVVLVEGGRLVRLDFNASGAGSLSTRDLRADQVDVHNASFTLDGTRLDRLQAAFAAAGLASLGSPVAGELQVNGQRVVGISYSYPQGSLRLEDGSSAPLAPWRLPEGTVVVEASWSGGGGLDLVAPAAAPAGPAAQLIADLVALARERDVPEVFAGRVALRGEEVVVATPRGEASVGRPGQGVAARVLARLVGHEVRLGAERARRRGDRFELGGEVYAWYPGEPWQYGTPALRAGGDSSGPLMPRAPARLVRLEGDSVQVLGLDGFTHAESRAWIAVTDLSFARPPAPAGGFTGTVAQPPH